MNIKQKSIRILHTKIGLVLKWNWIIFFLSNVVFLLIFIGSDFLRLKDTAAAWQSLFLNRLRQVEQMMDAGTTMPSVPLVHELIVSADGTIKTTPIEMLHGIILKASGFFGTISHLQPGERAVVLFQDLVDGRQRVHFVKRYADDFVVHSFAPGDFFPFPLTGPTHLSIVEGGVIWFADNPRRIGDLYHYAPFTITAGRLSVAFADTIPNMAAARLIITQDITAEIKILALTMCILLAIFGSFSLRTRKIQKDFRILQREQGDLMHLIQDLSAVVVQPGENVSDRLDHLVPALNQSVRQAARTPLQFVENHQYHLLVQEFIGEILSLVDAVKTEEDKLRAHEQQLTQYQEHLEDLVRERTAELTIAIEQAEKAKMAAEAANHAKSTFLANMSHELRTPLNGILGYAQILRRPRNLDDGLRDGLTVIYQSGRHLLTLINDILDLAKIEAHKVELNPTEMMFAEFLDGVIGIMRMRAQEKNVCFETVLAPQLPAGIEADETRLRQVLLNLLDNAVKFTDSGGTVTLHVETHGRASLRFSIQDTGVGMTAEQLESIFTPFEQVGDLARRTEGSGLGLAISKQLVELMGGTIQVTSTPGQGSTFWFEAALPATDATSAPAVSVTQSDITGYESERQLRILVVDEHAEIRGMLRDMLEPLGFEVLLAKNGQDGLNAAQSMCPDGILVHSMLPVHALRQRPEFQQIPIVAMSGDTSGMAQEQSRLAGCNAFVAKPLEIERLLDVLAGLLLITWTYADSSSASTADETSVELIPPPQADLESLYELAVLGKVFDIHAYVERLEAQDGRYRPFAQNVRALALAFEDKQIAALVQGYLEEY